VRELELVGEEKIAVFRAVCPGCRYPIELDRRIEAGEWVSCPRCEADLEVVSLHPLVLDWANEGLENAGVAWTWLAGAKWSRRGKTSERMPRAKVMSDDDTLY
jgi:lysine biosynthesis protein LysW